MALTNAELEAAAGAADAWPKGKGRVWAFKPGRPSNDDITARDIAVAYVQQEGYQP